MNITEMNEYIISSERAYRRDDESRIKFFSQHGLKVGDVIVLDGLHWYVEEVVKTV